MFLNRGKKESEGKKDDKQLKAEKVQMEKKKDYLKSIKEKGELKTEYQRILDGTDEKE